MFSTISQLSLAQFSSGAVVLHYWWGKPWNIVCLSLSANPSCEQTGCCNQLEYAAAGSGHTKSAVLKPEYPKFHLSEIFYEKWQKFRCTISSQKEEYTKQMLSVGWEPFLVFVGLNFSVVCTLIIFALPSASLGYQHQQVIRRWTITLLVHCLL